MLRTVRTAFRNLSLARKLVAINLAITSLVLIGGFAVVVWYDHTAARQRIVDDAQVLADVLGTNSTAAIAFGDPAAATGTLRGALNDAHVQTAAVLLPDGRIFARVDRSAAPALPALAADTFNRAGGWHQFSGNGLQVARAIVLDGDVIGVLYIDADLGLLRAMLLRHILVVGGVLTGAVVLAFALSLGLQRLISKPLLDLTAVARAVHADARYDIRAVAAGADEVGELV